MTPIGMVTKLRMKRRMINLQGETYVNDPLL